MDSFTPTARSRVKRGRDRAHYDRETIYAILDAGLFCHIAYCVDGQPYLIPSSYGREDDRLYLHGALANRTLKHLAQGAPAAIGVALVDGLIFARSQAYHSMNYRSVVLFGRATEVGELAARRRALTAIVEHMAPGRAGACRPPSELELKGTQVLEFRIEEASAKVRAGGAGDDEQDLALPHWAGELPLRLAPQPPRPASDLVEGVSVPEHIASWERR